MSERESEQTQLPRIISRRDRAPDSEIPRSASVSLNIWEITLTLEDK